jgi:hypothetical protein
MAPTSITGIFMRAKPIKVPSKEFRRPQGARNMVVEYFI